MIRIPLTKIGSPEAFAKLIDEHIAARTAHMMGKPDKPAPRANELVESVIVRVPADGPVATRGPDRFAVIPYEVYDDRPEPIESRLERERAALRLVKFRQSMQ